MHVGKRYDLPPGGNHNFPLFILTPDVLASIAGTAYSSCKLWNRDEPSLGANVEDGKGLGSSPGGRKEKTDIKIMEWTEDCVVL